MGAVGFGGCINGLLVWQAARSSARAPPKRRRKKKQRRADEDDSGNLVALTIGALAAAIIGALP